jgi:AcrR family transcriptional regulator
MDKGPHALGRGRAGGASSNRSEGMSARSEAGGHSEDAPTPQARRASRTAVEAVLAEARRVSEREGVEQLTMRRLAEGSGVAPNALYSHFADKSALLDALMDSLLADVEVPALDEVNWREGLLDLMRSTRRFLLRHADLLPQFLSRPRRGPNATRLGEETLKLLARAGLGGVEAIDALRILLIYTFGFVAQEAPRRMDPEPELRRMKNEERHLARRGITGSCASWRSRSQSIRATTRSKGTSVASRRHRRRCRWGDHRAPCFR